MLIGKRQLFWRQDDEIHEIPVELFAPEPGPDGGWRCRYRIGWPHGTKDSEGAGLDPIQTIYLTLTKIGADLYFSPFHKSGNLYWEKPGGGYGFPVPINARDLLVGDDARFM